MYVCMGASISVLYKIVVFMNQLTDAAKEQTKGMQTKTTKFTPYEKT